MINHFANLIWPTRPANACLTFTVISAAWAPKTNHSVHVPTDREFSAADAEALRALGEQQGCNTYLGLSARRPNLGSHSRGRKVDCIALPGFALDIDVFDPEAHAEPALPPNDRAACQLLEEFPVAPTLIVITGHGYQPYWLFDEPFILTPDTIGDVEARYNAFAAPLMQAAAAKGWKLDKTTSVDRIWRVPGFLNVKVRERPKMVELRVLQNARRYRITELSPGARPASALARATSSSPVDAATASAGGQFSTTPAPFVTPAAAAAALQAQQAAVPLNLARLRSKMEHLRNPVNRSLMARLYSGAPLDFGSRNNTLTQMVAILVSVEPGTSDLPAEAIFSVLKPTLEATRVRDCAVAGWEGNPPPTDAEARSLIARERVQVLDWRAKQRDQDRQLREEWLGPEQALALQEIIDAEEREPYTDDELFRWATTQQKCSRRAMKNRFIIAKDRAYWVFREGGYADPVSKDDLKICLRRDLAAAPIEWMKVDAKGVERPKTVDDLLAEYGTVARKLVAKLDASYSHYDQTEETFYEAICPLRPLTPLYNAGVDRWLRLLAVDEPLLIDWLATITHLDRQTAGCYISGPKGIGKGMLIQGLARLWTTGGATDFDSVVGDFNDGLTRCPLVAIDERASVKSEEQLTTHIRKLIGSQNHTLKRKFMPSASIQGAVRLLICGNNDELLISRERLGQMDLDATAERILYVPVGEAPAEYLCSIGSTKGTRGWVSEDIIARHVVWMRENITAIDAGRFLVAGHVTSMHRRLVTQNTVSSRICEFLAKYLESPRALDEKCGGKLIRAGRGRLLVSPRALEEGWRFYMPNARQADFEVLAKGLESISNNPKKQVRLAKQRVRDVKVEFLFAWAEQNAFGDVDAMRALIDRKLSRLKLVRADDEPDDEDDDPAIAPAAATPSPALLPFASNVRPIR